MTSKTLRPALRALAVAAGLAAGATAPALAGDVHFTIERIFGLPSATGVLPSDVVPTGINSHGNIAGSVYYLGGGSAFIREGGTFVALSDGIQLRSSANGLADNGTLIGSFNVGGGPSTPFSYTAATGVSVITAPAGSSGVAIDPTGQWLAVSNSATGSYVGRVGESMSFMTTGNIYGINRHGDYVGMEDTTGFAVRAGVRTNLPSAVLYDINRAGQAVGARSISPQRGLLLDGNTVIDLGTAPGSNARSTALAISDSGIIVGLSDDGPLVFDAKAGFRRLSDLVPGLDRDTLSTAQGVNDHGQITGRMKAAAGARFAYILTPTGTLRWDGGSSGRFTDAARWDSGAGLMPSKFLDVVFAPAGNATTVADSSVSMKSLVVGSTSGGATSRLQLAGGARLVATASPVLIEARGLLVGDGTLAGKLINRGTVGELGGAPLALTIEGELDNTGLVTGSGTIAASLINRSGPGVRVEGGQRLQFLGALHSNADAGRIEIRQGGELAFSGQLVNQGGAFLRIDNGTLRTGSLANGGLVQIGFGGASIFGDVNNSPATDPNRGRIMASGAAEVTFWDRVNNQGEIRASAGSRLLYFRAVTGNGSFTTNGGGYHRFEGGFTPTSAALAGVDMSATSATLFAATATLGDVQFASTVTLNLAGTVAGVDHDQLVFTGDVLFDSGSRLQVLLGAGFAPSAGQSFKFFDYTLSPSGQFSAVALPTLDPLLAWDTSGLYSSGLLTVQVVPEPSSWALMLMGGMGLAAWLRRRLGCEA
jgi:hypothetical protein